VKLRTFNAPDMPSAMRMVKDALGENAIILNTQSLPNKGGVVLTAAIDEDDDLPSFQPPPSQTSNEFDLSRQARFHVGHSQQLDDVRFELQNIFRFHNIPDLFMAKLVQLAKPEELETVLASRRSGDMLVAAALEKILAKFFNFDPIVITRKPARIMLVGTPGIGKTLSIAKLATQLCVNKVPLHVITTDNSRAGGIEQLQAFTNILEVPLHVVHNVKELGILLTTLPNTAHVLIDTAGCNPFNQREFKELETIANLPGVEPILVMPAGGDSLEAVDMVEIFSTLPIRRMFVTRADSARRFGGIIASAAAHGIAFSSVSRTASLQENINALTPALLAEFLQRYKY
jgi:flagellar biosynthesis protein FlhF